MITFASNFYLFMFNQICIWLQITGSPEKRYPQRTLQQGTVSVIDLHLSLKINRCFRYSKSYSKDQIKQSVNVT